MTSLLKQISQNRAQYIGGLLILLASGLPWWLTDYRTYSLNSTNTYISIGSCFLGAFILSLFTGLSFIEKLATPLIAHLIAFVIKLVIDGLEDPTNHNLFPFEIIFYMVIDAVGCVVLIFLGGLIRKMFRK